MADALKKLGNDAIAAKQYDEAIKHFTEAIGIEPENHILYSNRSAAYASKKDYDHALEDAEKTTELKPDWAKGWGRKGAAAHGKGDLIGALDAYEEGLKLDPNNAANKAGLASVKSAIDAEAAADGIRGNSTDPFADMFSDPQAIIKKLAANPKTSKFLSDPAFMNKLMNMKNNPGGGAAAMMGDPRMMQVLGVLMGIDMDFAAPGDAGPSGESKTEAEEEDVPMPDAPRPASTQKQEPKKASNPTPEKTLDLVSHGQPTPESEGEPENGDAAAKAKAKADAEEEKKLGTENYKKKNFDEAIKHYTKAWELHKDITYLNNLGAANFEKGDYEAAIKACEQAVEEGREIYADFKMIAKSYARIGSSYEKLGDLEKAIENYKKSMTEHRTPETVNKLRAAEKRKIDAATQAYINPEKAEEARELGNAKFKEADWPAAVQAYSEMINRAPEDPRGYSNRAAAFIKLLEFPSAITDLDLAIKKDPKFIRAYLRKAQAYFGMREYSKCLDVCTEAAEIDVTKANAKEIEQQQQKALAAMYSARDNETEEQTRERISRDPQIMEIMQDPVMQSILQQAQGDPAALQEHMKNPGIRAKIQKLIASGIIRVGR